MDGLLHTIQINHNSPGCIAGLSGSVLNLWTPYIILPTAELRENCRTNFRTIQQVQLILSYLSSKYSSLALLDQARGCKNCVTSKLTTEWWKDMKAVLLIMLLILNMGTLLSIVTVQCNHLPISSWWRVM